MGLFAGGQTVNQQQENCSHHGGDEPRWIPHLIPAQRPPQKSGDKRTGDPEQDGDDETTRILAGHEELGDDPDNEADDEHPDEFHCVVDVSGVCARD